MIPEIEPEIEYYKLASKDLQKLREMTYERCVWFENFCDFILQELDELEYNTWDKDRVRRLKCLINNQKDFQRLKNL